MAANTIYLNTASQLAPFLPTFTWNDVGYNGEHKAEAQAAPGHIWDQRHAQAETLTLTGSLDLHAAVGLFDRFHCSWLVSSEKKNRVPKLLLLVLLRGETWQHHTTPHSTHNLKYRQRILCRLLSRLAKNIECSSLADWLTDPIVKTCMKKVWL